MLVRIFVIGTKVQLAIYMDLVFNMLSFQFYKDFCQIIFNEYSSKLQISGFACLKSKLKDSVLSFIWFQLLNAICIEHGLQYI